MTEDTVVEITWRVGSHRTARSRTGESYWATSPQSPPCSIAFCITDTSSSAVHVVGAPKRRSPPREALSVDPWGLSAAVLRVSEMQNRGMPALYIDPLRDFLKIKPEKLLRRLTSGLATEGFDRSYFTPRHQRRPA